MKIHIKGVRPIDVGHARAQPDAATDLFIADGLIAAIGTAPADFAADRVFDAHGLAVMPGLIDLAVRLREYGVENHAAESEMAAAMAGGVTRLVCQPDTDPVRDEAALVDAPGVSAEALNLPRVLPLGALTVGLNGTRLANMAELHEAGCIGFSQADSPILDTQVLLSALHYAATYDYPVWLRAQDPYLARGGVAASGPVALRLGLAGIPASAETIALHRILELVRVTGARVHLPRLSSAGGVALVRAAKQEGLRVSCDVTINHVHLIDADIGYFDPHYRLDPPLRGQRDRDAIRAGLLDGTIDAICSDHRPLGDEAKRRPFAEAAPGATGLELLLSLTIKWAQEARVPLAQALAKLTSGPAAVLGLPATGGQSCAVAGLTAGAEADLCLFDPTAYWTVSPATLRSRGSNTPFLGFELPAQVHATLVTGNFGFERAGTGVAIPINFPP